MARELIAFDMDGTLLDSNKRILPSSSAAIERAASRGKFVAIATGRCPSMIKPYAAEIPGVRYAICASGASIYDIARDEVLTEHLFDQQVIDHVVEVVGDEELMCEIFTGREFYYPAADMGHMDRYHMEAYQEVYRKLGNPIESTWDLLAAGTLPLQKFNLHFAHVEARERVIADLAGADLDLARAETSSLEFSPRGVNKGAGLTELAGILGIPVEGTIAVGDSDNDLPMLERAGLAVAMGNAREHVREAAGAIVSDNDHDGCAEAIERFLLGGEDPS